MSKTVSTSGISTAGLLGIAFVTLKLLHVIDWSWWWVTLPFWGGAALVIVLLGIWAIVAGFAGLIGTVHSIFRKK